MKPLGTVAQSLLKPIVHVLALSSIATFCLTAMTAGAAADNDTTIWKYDFREKFYDVAFLSPQEAVIVGDRGRVLLTHKKYKNLWSPGNSGTKELLTCVSFIDDTQGWAAGHGGIIIHTIDGGQTWGTQRESSPQNQPLFGIQFVSPTTGFACGPYNTFLKTADGGKSWTAVPTGFDYIYNGLAFVDEDRGYLVGELGALLQTADGAKSWGQLNPGGHHQGSLFGVTLLDEHKILVYGVAGKVFRSEDSGHTWEDVSPGIHQCLFRGAARGDDVVLVGGSGTILCSRDGGKKYTEHNDKDLTTFAGVCAHPGGGFLCVGATGKITRVYP